MSFFDFHIYQTVADREPVPLESGQLQVFVDEEDYTPETQSLLGKILAAAKNEISQTPIYKVTAEVKHYPIKDLKKGALLVSFNVPSDLLGINCDIYPYRLFTIDNRHYLFCDSLGEISKDGQKKKLLWSALKTHFNL